jgi:creatinine amidohydrolase
MNVLGKETYFDIRKIDPKFFVLPIGSYEQHGRHLPMVTDTLMALAISNSIAEAHQGHVLSPITISCSQEHAGFTGSTWISSSALTKMLNDIVSSLEHAGVNKLVIVNGHGGNYVVKNFAQESNLSVSRVLLLPTTQHHNEAAKKAGFVKNISEDMHGGEYETSVLMSAFPEYVKEEFIADTECTERPLLTLLGMKGYTDTGIIGYPTLATKEKGDIFLEALPSIVSKDLNHFLSL